MTDENTKSIKHFKDVLRVILIYRVQIFYDSTVHFETQVPSENATISQNNYTSPQPEADRTTLTVPTPKPRGDLQISVSYVSNLEFQNVPP